MTAAAAMPNDDAAREALTAFRRADQARFASIPLDRLLGAVAAADPKEKYDCVQDRTGEAQRGISDRHALEAIYNSPWFWDAARLLPRNDLSVPSPGRPKDYPDWALFLFEMVAAITRTASRASISTYFSHPDIWADFVLDVDTWVPDDMTPLGEINHEEMKENSPRKKTTLAKPMGRRRGNVVPLQRRRARRQARAALKVLPPEPHHSDYFAQLWRGLGSNGSPLPEGHPWHGLGRRVMEQFRAGAVAQLQEMGAFNPHQELGFLNADRNQYIGVDGVVFPMSKKRTAACIEKHRVGGGSKEVTGSKMTIASARISGQYMSRVICDIISTAKHDPQARATDEADAIRKALPEIAALTEVEVETDDGEVETKRGLKGVLVDSVVRGECVIALQRQGMTVVNYPHAKNNPDGTVSGRINPERIEKNHLRTIVEHKDENGDRCRHAIYAVGGELMQLLDDYTGQTQPVPLKILGYKQRKNPNGQYRDYHQCQIACDITGEVITRLIPLFHNSPGDPNYNWGEVCRVFPPSSAEFQYLYGGRNDTESRHTDLKSRAKYLPADIPGQELRLLAASMVSNAIAWQVHCQAWGDPNVFDGTS